MNIKWNVAKDGSVVALDSRSGCELRIRKAEEGFNVEVEDLRTGIMQVIGQLATKAQAVLEALDAIRDGLQVYEQAA